MLDRPGPTLSMEVGWIICWYRDLIPRLWSLRYEKDGPHVSTFRSNLLHLLQRAGSCLHSLAAWNSAGSVLFHGGLDRLYHSCGICGGCGCTWRGLPTRDFGADVRILMLRILRPNSESTWIQTAWFFLLVFDLNLEVHLAIWNLWSMYCLVLSLEKR